MVNKQKTNSMKKKLLDYLNVCIGELQSLGGGFDELATNALKQCLNTTCLLEHNTEDTLIQLENSVYDEYSSYMVDGVLLDEDDKTHVMFMVTDGHDEIQSVELTDISRASILEVIMEIERMLQFKD